MSLLIRSSTIRTALFVCILLLASCAQIVAPTGGAKDIQPPKIEKELPVNKTTSFTEQKIVLKFDEYVQLKDAEEQIVISPPMQEKPVFTVSGKSISIQLMGKLKPNTTYTINFGNSIADNHESTVLGNYSYVFSTGSVIDTLTIKGSVKHAFDLKTEKGLSVCLYPVDSFTDSTIFKQKPHYFTKSNGDGSFILPNLPNKIFKLVVFKDENKNLKYDPSELIAFYNKPIATTDTLLLKPFFYFKPNAYVINRLIDTFSREPGRFTFVVYKPTGIAIKPVIPVTFQTWFKKGKDGIDTITLYNPTWKTDSILFNFHTPQFDSTVLIKPRKNTKVGKLDIILKKDIELNDTFGIILNHPFDTFTTDTSKLKLIEDSVLVKPLIITSKNKESIQLYYPIKEKVKYSLILNDSAIRDIYNNYSKTEKLSFTAKSLKDYSTLALSVTHPKDAYQYILQLIDESDTKVYKTFIITQSTNINIDYVLPAKYRIKFIRDINTNGIWDNGDYMAYKQPEQVFYYPEPLTLRAYWDLEQTIDMSKIVD
ncbi:MAG: Ig-like domain-containing protein [Bacteroidota bacterium]